MFLKHNNFFEVEERFLRTNPLNSRTMYSNITLWSALALACVLLLYFSSKSSYRPCLRDIHQKVGYY